MSRLRLLVIGSTVLAATLSAQDAAKVIPDYSQTERAKVPVALTWKVEDIFSSQNAFRAELAEVRKEIDAVGVLAKGWTTSGKTMADFLLRLTEVRRRTDRLFTYASLQSDMDLANSQLQKMKGEVQVLYLELGSRTATLGNDVQALGEKEVAARVQAEPRLKSFAYRFERDLRDKPHTPSQAQQEVLSLTGLLTDAPPNLLNILNDSEIPRSEWTTSGGDKVTLNRNAYLRYRGSKNVAERRGAMEAYWKSQKAFENSLATAMDAGIKRDYFFARVRGFKTCLDAALYSDAIPTEVYSTLLKSTRDNLQPLHRYLRLKKRLLGLSELRYGDVYASAATQVDRRTTYDEAIEILQKALAPMGSEFAGIVRKGYENRWVDIYANKGKMSGAYCSGVYGTHPFVKVNYDGSYQSMSLLAHEMGHAIHYVYSESQPYQNSEPNGFVAEIASNFNEMMLINYLVQRETDDRLKLYMLENYLESIRTTLFRQTIFAELDLFMHEQVEQGINLTAESLNAKYLEIMRTYYGHDQGVMNVEEYIGIEWSIVTQYFLNYYEYQYSTGIIAAMALVDAASREGEPARQRYISFLKAGGRTWPLDILKQAGVDMTKPEPFQAAMRTFDRLVGEMETIAGRLEKK